MPASWTGEPIYNAQGKQIGTLTDVLIDPGGGATVDQKALVGALQHGKIAGAGIDVFEQEAGEGGESFAEDGKHDCYTALSVLDR